MAVVAQGQGRAVAPDVDGDGIIPEPQGAGGVGGLGTVGPGDERAGVGGGGLQDVAADALAEGQLADDATTGELVGGVGPDGKKRVGRDAFGGVGGLWTPGLGDGDATGLGAPDVDHASDEVGGAIGVSVVGGGEGLKEDGDIGLGGRVRAGVGIDLIGSDGGGENEGEGGGVAGGGSGVIEGGDGHDDGGLEDVLVEAFDELLIGRESGDGVVGGGGGGAADLPALDVLAVAGEDGFEVGLPDVGVGGHEVEEVSSGDAGDVGKFAGRLGEGHGDVVSGAEQVLDEGVAVATESIEVLDGLIGGPDGELDGTAAQVVQQGGQVGLLWGGELFGDDHEALCFGVRGLGGVGQGGEDGLHAPHGAEVGIDLEVGPVPAEAGQVGRPLPGGGEPAVDSAVHSVDGSAGFVVDDEVGGEGLAGKVADGCFEGGLIGGAEDAEGGVDVQGHTRQLVDNDIVEPSGGVDVLVMPFVLLDELLTVSLGLEQFELEDEPGGPITAIGEGELDGCPLVVGLQEIADDAAVGEGFAFLIDEEGDKASAGVGDFCGADAGGDEIVGHGHDGEDAGLQDGTGAAAVELKFEGVVAAEVLVSVEPDFGEHGITGAVDAMPVHGHAFVVAEFLLFEVKHVYDTPGDEGRLCVGLGVGGGLCERGGGAETQTSEGDDARAKHIRLIGHRRAGAEAGVRRGARGGMVAERGGGADNAVR